MNRRVHDWKTRLFLTSINVGYKQLYLFHTRALFLIYVITLLQNLFSDKQIIKKGFEILYFSIY